MVKQVDSNDLVIRDPETALPSGRRDATKEEIKAAKERKKTRQACGLPPWVAVGPESWLQQQAPERAVVLESSKSLRQWADEYCASDKLLKEFTYTKVRSSVSKAPIVANANEKYCLDCLWLECHQSSRGRCRRDSISLQPRYHSNVRYVTRQDPHPSRQQLLPHAFQHVDEVPPLDPPHLPLHLAV